MKYYGILLLAIASSFVKADGFSISWKSISFETEAGVKVEAEVSHPNQSLVSLMLDDGKHRYHLTGAILEGIDHVDLSKAEVLHSISARVIDEDIVIHSPAAVVLGLFKLGSKVSDASNQYLVKFIFSDGSLEDVWYILENEDKRVFVDCQGNEIGGVPPRVPRNDGCPD